MKNSLRTRSLLVVLITLSLVLGANTFILSLGFISFQKNTLQNKTRLIGENLRDRISRAINLGLPLESLEGVNESCRDIVDSNKDIGYCMLVDKAGRVVYHNDPLMAGRFPRDDAGIKAADYYDVSVPILNPDQRPMGSIRLGLKYDALSSRIYPLLWQASAVALVTFILASVLVNFLVSRKIVSPIIELSHTASLIAEGDLSRRIEITSSDEVGQLAGSFNRMAESLQEREGRLNLSCTDLAKANEDLQSSYLQLESTAVELELKSLHLNEKVKELSFLHDATDRLRANIELAEILESVVRDITEGLGYDRVMLSLVDQRTSVVEEKVSVGFDGKERELLSELLDTPNIFSAAVNKREAMYVAQARLDSRVPSRLVDNLNLAEFAIIPMVGKDRCVGAILVDNRKTSRPIRKDKLDILTTFASTAAMAVENAYLYRQLVDNLDTVERANMELRKLDKTKTNFLALASHELRTPLVSVMGYLNLMLAGDLGEISETQRELLEIAGKGATRLRDIMEDLLMVAKIEGGRLTLNLRWVSVSDVAEASIMEVTPLLGQRSVTISTAALDTLPKVEADFDRLQQCFTHLIGNAVKFTPDGGRITISGRQVKVDKESGRLKPLPHDDSMLASDTCVEITFEDTGIGIDRENLEKVFDKFFEAGEVDSHSTSKTKFMGGGTGLGLSIVKGIVESHGGRIWADSEGEDPGECPGTRLTMLLPIKQGALKAEMPSPPEAKAAPAAQVSPEKQASRKSRVLLVEDDEDIITFTRLVLDKRFEVEVAKDGFEGLKKAFSFRPSVILLDVWMHGMDGYEVCRILKENKRTADIPVAMFTAAAQKHEMERGYEAGADDYITKPFTPAELILRIEKLVARSASIA